MKVSKLVAILALIFSGCILQPAVGASLSSEKRENLIQAYLQNMYEEEARENYDFECKSILIKCSM